MQLRLSGFTQDSIVDGPGLRATVFLQGCPHRCPGCHNPQTHAFDGGTLMDTQALLQKIAANPLLDGVTFSGGEPFCQAQALCHLARGVRALGLNLWCYTGYLFEELLEKGDPHQIALLRELDVLVDGPFIQEQRSLELTFCGSRNQRIIDVHQSLAAGTAVTIQL
ncbi:anaerobic ribonucleoside-triphosphate reductase activating protein [Christensenellaceae bacterium NSJ-44]|uniref:Anaerobic ribonucleoside-triphosphate reductase-activating protein n=1 Tax=Luoshenia tenuis TaxID=2763654 RepID=A0A926CYP2_9FIRM|nr:anaerobic ribonucleoside-triphosphate reductase activating protein [Luoshenia tenuis]MBC8528397.1 anaerobic ribonucleoside-triphosphate reductase activating protein [Luoshenia tenuis]